VTGVVVFDVDDTLYLERDYVRSGFRAVGEVVGELVGYSGFAEVAWKLFLEGRRGDIFDAALIRLGLPDGHLEIGELVEVYRTHEPEIQMLDDSHEVLVDARRAGFHLAVVTDGPAASQRAKVAALELEGLVDLVVVTEELGAGMGKPHPAAFVRVESFFGCRGADLTYIADNPTKDFSAPKDRGWRTVRVRRPLGLHAHLVSGEDVDVEVLDLVGWAPGPLSVNSSTGQ
jgi:putative hydrolase of the HAD superfamily